MVAALGFGNAHAQRTLGEALDKGAVKLTKAEWISMMPYKDRGPGFSSVVVPGSPDTQLVFTLDGKMRGWGRNQIRFDISGRWKIDEAGKFCVDETYYAYSALQGSYEGCYITFKLGANIFLVAADSESNRSAKVIMRTAEK